MYYVSLTFTVGLSHPVGAVGVHHAHQLTSNQFMFGWALQGNDCAHIGTIALDDPLGAKGWQGHGRALSLRLTWKKESDCWYNMVYKKNKSLSIIWPYV